MPTAVITESSEKTMSSSVIWIRTRRERRRARARMPSPSSPFEPGVDLVRALGEQEQAADDQDQIAARQLVARARVKSGAVSRTIQASENSSRMRVPIASSRPSRRADALLRGRAACRPGWR